MRDVIPQPISREQLTGLAAGGLDAAERRRIVRQLLTQAGRSLQPALPGRLLVAPVAAASYEQSLERALERAWRLYERLAGRDAGDGGDGFDAPAAIRYSPSVPAGRRT